MTHDLKAAYILESYIFHHGIGVYIW